MAGSVGWKVSGRRGKGWSSDVVVGCCEKEMGVWGLGGRLREKRKNQKKRGVGGWRPVLVREKKRFSFFRVSPFFVLPLTKLQNAPPVLSFGPIFIGKMLPGTQNWSLNFLFL